MLVSASHGERIPLSRDPGLLPGLWAGGHVASPRDAAVDYFVSARALDMPRVAAVGRHHFTTGHAAGE